MSSIVSIFTSLFSFASGGWGSFAAIIALLVAGFALYRMYKKAKEEKAHNDSLDQAVIDSTQDITNNQTQGDQANKDNAAADAAHDQALKDLSNRP